MTGSIEMLSNLLFNNK